MIPILDCSLLNRLRGIGVIKKISTISILNRNIDINFNGNHLYGLYLAILIGFITSNYLLGIIIFIGYLIGEAKGWGEWVGTLSNPEPITESMVERNYKDTEGKGFPFIHQISNFLIPEKAEDIKTNKVSQYKKYATLALIFRGIYWWTPMYISLAIFNVISYIEAVCLILVLGFMFPISCILGSKLKFEKKYECTLIKVNFSRGWENQEAIYGIFQGIAIWYVLLGYIYG